MTFAERLQKLAESLGFDRSSIAKATGLRPGHVHKLFSGSNDNPSLQTLELLAKALGVTLDSFGTLAPGSSPTVLTIHISGRAPIVVPLTVGEEPIITITVSGAK